MKFLMCYNSELYKVHLAEYFVQIWYIYLQNNRRENTGINNTYRNNFPVASIKPSGVSRTI